MPNIPKKVSDRLASETKKYQKILTDAKNRDANESDTVTIITDMLADIFGYDKYSEVTSEQQIKGTFCDLAVEINNKTEFLIEAKAIGQELNENHLRQALGYGFTKGIYWIILTNGVSWKIHKISEGVTPLHHEEILSFDMLEINARKKEEQEKLFVLCKEGIRKSAIDLFHKRVSVVNKYMIGAIMQSEAVIKVIRRELRKSADGMAISMEDVEEIVKNETLKQIVVEGEQASLATKAIKKIQRAEKAQARTEKKAA